MESTCKAVAIKYTALVCYQISSYVILTSKIFNFEFDFESIHLCFFFFIKKHKKKDSVESISEDFDSYLVNVFAYLLNAFKQEHR